MRHLSLGLRLRAGLVLGLAGLIGLTLGFTVGIRLVSAERVDAVITEPDAETAEPRYTIAPNWSMPDTIVTDAMRGTT